MTDLERIAIANDLRMLRAYAWDTRKICCFGISVLFLLDAGFLLYLMSR